MDRQNSPPSTLDRTLRAITVFNLIPTICFMIPYGVIAKKVVEPVTVLPASLSALYGLICFIIFVRRRGGDKPRLGWRVVQALIDAFLALFTIGMLVACWVDMPYGWAGKRLVMVATYGTIGLMVNFIIHTFLFFRSLASFLREGTHRECPHCHHDLSIPARLPSFRRQIILGGGGGGKESYQPLTEEYDEDARESSDIMSSAPPTERFSAETLRSSQRDSSSSSRETAIKLVEA